MGSLPLLDADDLSGEIHVADPHLEQLALPRPRVGGGRHQRVNPWMVRPLLEISQQSLDLRQGEVERLPELLDLRAR